MSLFGDIWSTVTAPFAAASQAYTSITTPQQTTASESRSAPPQSTQQINPVEMINSGVAAVKSGVGTTIGTIESAVRGPATTIIPAATRIASTVTNPLMAPAAVAFAAAPVITAPIQSLFTERAQRQESQLSKGTVDVYAPYGSYAQIKIPEAKVLMGYDTGEISIYQKPAGHSIFNLVSGGGRAAVQSGAFTIEKPETPYVVEQERIGTYELPSGVGMSRLGAEAYGGRVQALDSRTLSEKISASVFENLNNLANFVNPQGANLGKATAPGARIPWSVSETAPAVGYFEGGIAKGGGAAPAQVAITPQQDFVTWFTGGKTIEENLKQVASDKYAASTFGGTSGGILGRLAFGEAAPEVIRGAAASSVDYVTSIVKWTPFKDVMQKTDVNLQTFREQKTVMESKSPEEYNKFLQENLQKGVLVKEPITGKYIENPDLTYDYGEFSKWGIGAGAQVRGTLGISKEQLAITQYVLEQKKGIQYIPEKLGFGALETLSTRPERFISAAGGAAIMVGGGEILGAGATATGLTAAAGRFAAAYPNVARVTEGLVKIGVPAAVLGLTYYGASEGLTASPERTTINLGKMIPEAVGLGVGFGAYRLARGGIERGYIGYQQKEIKTIVLNPELLKVEAQVPIAEGIPRRFTSEFQRPEWATGQQAIDLSKIKEVPTGPVATELPRSLQAKEARRAAGSQAIDLSKITTGLEAEPAAGIPRRFEVGFEKIKLKPGESFPREIRITSEADIRLVEPKLAEDPPPGWMDVRTTPITSPSLKPLEGEISIGKVRTVSGRSGLQQIIMEMEKPEVATIPEIIPERISPAATFRPQVISTGQRAGKLFGRVRQENIGMKAISRTTELVTEQTFERITPANVDIPYKSETWKRYLELPGTYEVKPISSYYKELGPTRADFEAAMRTPQAESLKPIKGGYSTGRIFEPTRETLDRYLLMSSRYESGALTGMQERAALKEFGATKTGIDIAMESSESLSQNTLSSIERVTASSLERTQKPYIPVEKMMREIEVGKIEEPWIPTTTPVSKRISERAEEPWIPVRALERTPVVERPTVPYVPTYIPPYVPIPKIPIIPLPPTTLLSFSGIPGGGGAGVRRGFKFTEYLSFVYPVTRTARTRTTRTAPKKKTSRRKK